MDHGPKGLAHHGRQAAVNDAGDTLADRELAGQRLRPGGIKRHQWVQAKHQVNALVHRYAGVHGFFQSTVNKILVVNFYRWEKPWQRRAGLHGF